MKFVNPYHWLYSKIYLTQYKITGSSHSRVVTTISLMIIFNLATIVCLIDMFIYIPLSQVIPDLLISAIPFVCIFFFVMNMYYFMFKEVGEKILLEFDVKSQIRKRYYYMPGLLYNVLSLVAVLFILPLRSRYGFH